MESSVREFFDGAHVLVTGGTGFMGKVLTEKLLRTCRGIEQLYLIIRVKKGKEPIARLKELFDDPVFGQLKIDYPDFLTKVTCVAGDCSMPGLGLSDSDRVIMAARLTHVFHGAATVRFDEKLRLAVAINVLGVREMINFCRSCPKLKSVIHTSTAYCHAPLQNIQEQFYGSPMTGDAAIHLVECMEDSKLEALTPEIIKPWPNTYAFTKAIGEDVVQKYGVGLPIGVFRPAIVVSTAEGPIRGWIDNLYGPTGVCIGVGAGVLRVLYADENAEANLVPVDMAVNAMICAAREVSLGHNSPTACVTSTSKSQVPVYHYVSSKKNPLTWRQYLSYTLNHGKELPSNQTIWYYTLTLTNVWFIYKLLMLFYHIIPGALMDAALLLSGNKPQMLKAYKKIHKFGDVISFFNTREWNFGNKNTNSLWNTLSETDRKLFNFDNSELDWNSYLRDTVIGCRLYIFKENQSTIPAARRRLFCLKIVHHLLQLVIYSALGYILYAVLLATLSAYPDVLTQLTSARWASRKISHS